MVIDTFVCRFTHKPHNGVDWPGPEIKIHSMSKRDMRIIREFVAKRIIGKYIKYGNIVDNKSYYLVIRRDKFKFKSRLVGPSDHC